MVRRLNKAALSGYGGYVRVEIHEAARQPGYQKKRECLAASNTGFPGDGRTYEYTLPLRGHGN